MPVRETLRLNLASPENRRGIFLVEIPNQFRKLFASRSVFLVRYKLLANSDGENSSIHFLDKERSLCR